MKGRRHDIPGVETLNWADNPGVPRTTKVNTRKHWLRSIGVHTVHGIRGKLLPGTKPSNRAETYAHYQASTERQVSWDFTLDTDKTLIQSNDPEESYTWHATAANPYSMGIELVQERNGDLYQGEMDAFADFADFSTALLFIPRFVPGKNGQIVSGVIQRMATNPASYAGIWGHRNQTTNRGFGDPNDFPFLALKARKYRLVDIEAGEDREIVRGLQKELRIAEDGTYGPGTRIAAKAAVAAGSMTLERALLMAA